MLAEYIGMKKRGDEVDLHYVQQLMGQLNWYSSVEPNYWDAALKRLNEKYATEVVNLMLDDLRA